MALKLAALVAPTYFGPYTFPHLTTDFGLAGVSPWRGAFAGSLNAGGNILVPHRPVTTGKRQRQGTAAGAYLYDYYHRIHVIPGRMDLGNVASTQYTSAWIWNAHFDPRTLTAIEGQEEGLIVSGQPDPPQTFVPLEEREYKISITPDGKPVLDAVLTWVFGGESGDILITANRIIAFTWAPNWGDKVEEKLTWLTDILQSESLMAQRRAVRTVPRREFSASFVVAERERQFLDNALFGWGARVWAIPLWAEVQWLAVGVAAGATECVCKTDGFDFAIPGLVLFRGTSAFESEVAEVAQIGPGTLTFRRPLMQSWPAGTRLYPVRRAQITKEPTFTRHTDNLAELDVDFLCLEPSDWPGELPEKTYRTFPVLEARPDESDDLTREYARLLKQLDNKVGIPKTTDVAGRALPVMSWRWLDCGRAKQTALRRLLYGLRGQQRAVWVPTHGDDLSLLEPAPETGSVLVVGNTGYARFCLGRTGRKDIRIELADGTVLLRRVVAAGELSPEKERLELDSVHGVPLSPANVARISYLVLSTLADDAVKWEHHTDAEGVAEVALTFKGVRDDDLS